jgi:pimeloyl-ACP methyl ester carboxylesterase
MQHNNEWKPVNVSAGEHSLAALVRDADTTLPPIVFLHGITASVSLWPAILDRHFTNRRCVSISLPGHAPSRVPADFCGEQVTAKLFSGTVAAATRRLFPNERVHVVGWSTGGFAALMTAAHHVDRVASVTSICGFVRGQWGDLLGLMQRLAGHRLGRRAFRWNLRQLSRQKWLLDTILKRLAARPIEHDDLTNRALATMHEAVRQHDPSALQHLFEAIRSIDATSELKAVRAPVCVIGGTRDPVIRLSETQYIADTLPTGSLYLLEDAGHMFFAEDRGTVMQLIDQTCRRGDETRHEAGSFRVR